MSIFAIDFVWNHQSQKYISDFILFADAHEMSIIRCLKFSSLASCKTLKYDCIINIQNT